MAQRDPTTSSMWRPPPTDDPALAAIATQEAVIMELTRILSEREAEINLVAQQNLSMERFFQEQQRQMIKANSAITYRDLDGTATQISETAKKVASLEEEGKSQREAMLVAEETIKKKDELIEQLKQEKVVITKKLTETETQVAKTAKKVASLEEKSKSQREAMSVAEDTIKEKDELIVQLKQQGKNSRFMDENERLIEEVKKATHAMESSDILINAQRHRIEELETLLNTYEKRFLTKDVDVPKILARADEGDRLWSKIEEREKKFKAREIIVGVVRDENKKLLSEKKNLQAEIDELKRCFEMVNINLGTPGQEAQMPWLMSQLRENVSLKEKVNELEEIIRCKGYTVKAAAAEHDFKMMELRLASEMEELTKVIEMLKGQLVGVEDFEVPVFLGKLEEALLVFGHEVGMHSTSTVVSEVSKDSKEEDSWDDGGCFLWKDTCARLDR